MSASAIARRSLALATTAGVWCAAILASAPQADAATIYACVKKKDGAVRIVSRSARCKRSEKKISWNSVGPAGKNGLPGAPGAKGETGARGETGQPPTTLWAVVETNGSLDRGGSGAVGSSLIFGPNGYEVVFNRDVRKCAYIATVGEVSGGEPSAGFIGVASRSEHANAVFVRTFNVKGEAAAESFHIAVFC